MARNCSATLFRTCIRIGELSRQLEAAERVILMASAAPAAPAATSATTTALATSGIWPSLVRATSTRLPCVALGVRFTGSSAHFRYGTFND